MWPITTLVIGLAIGFIIGWLVRDYLTSEKRLLRAEDGFGHGNPGTWKQQQQGRYPGQMPEIK